MAQRVDVDAKAKTAYKADRVPSSLYNSRGLMTAHFRFSLEDITYFVFNHHLPD